MMDKINELLKDYKRVEQMDGLNYIASEPNGQEQQLEGGSVLIQTTLGDYKNDTDVTNVIVDKEEDVIPHHYDQLVEILYLLKGKEILIRSGPDKKKYFSADQGREILSVVTRIIYYDKPQ